MSEAREIAEIVHGTGLLLDGDPTVTVIDSNGTLVYGCIRQPCSQCQRVTAALADAERRAEDARFAFVCPEELESATGIFDAAHGGDCAGCGAPKEQHRRVPWDLPFELERAARQRADNRVKELEGQIAQVARYGGPLAEMRIRAERAEAQVARLRGVLFHCAAMGHKTHEVASAALRGEEGP